MMFYNDLAQLPYYLLYAFGLLTIMSCSIILHELGHILVFWTYGIKTEVTFHKINKRNIYFETGKQEDYDKLNESQYMNVVWVGIVLGSIPCFIAGFIYWPNILLLLPYGLGCVSDFKSLNIKIEEE